MKYSDWRHELDLVEGPAIIPAILSGLGKTAKVAYGVSKVAAPIAEVVLLVVLHLVLVV